MTQYAAWSSLGGPAQQYHRATAIHRPQAQLQLGASPGPKLAHMRRHGQMVVKLVTAVAREGSLKTARVPERCSKTRNVQGGSKFKLRSEHTTANRRLYCGNRTMRTMPRVASPASPRAPTVPRCACTVPVLIYAVPPLPTASRSSRPRGGPHGPCANHNHNSKHKTHRSTAPELHQR